jgi:hypothetical protein
MTYLMTRTREEGHDDLVEESDIEVFREIEKSLYAHK